MSQIPDGPKDLFCPYWRQRMSKVCRTCPKWMHIRGRDPQTGQELDRWECSDVVVAKVQIEAVSAMRGNQSAVESFRNEMVRQNNQVITQVRRRANEIEDV